MTDIDISTQNLEKFQSFFEQSTKSISQYFIGQPQLIRHLWIAFMAGGHVLLEGLPGLGKTFLVQTFSKIMNLEFKRIQFTPDLMPADILGTNIIVPTTDGMPQVSFEKGPIFTELLLADEINRATPRTQSALLEAMQEKKVTLLGKTHILSPHFMVIATQNSIEMEGTYPLPEAQLDRFFFKLYVEYPSLEELIQIGTHSFCQQSESFSRDLWESLQKLIAQVEVADHILQKMATIILLTQPTKKDSPKIVQQYVQHGISPRGFQTLLLSAKINALIEGRFYVSQDDYKEVLFSSLQHRLLINFAGETENITSHTILQYIIEHM